jgi:hypothetical protein
MLHRSLAEAAVVPVALRERAVGDHVEVVVVPEAAEGLVQGHYLLGWP